MTYRGRVEGKKLVFKEDFDSKKPSYPHLDLPEEYYNIGIGIVYLKKFREYGIRILNGGSSIKTIQYCPWSGKLLPKSLRDEWFDTLEELGFDDPRDQEIPEEFKTDKWWKDRKL